MVLVLDWLIVEKLTRCVDSESGRLNYCVKPTAIDNLFGSRKDAETQRRWDRGNGDDGASPSRSDAHMEGGPPCPPG